MSDAQPRSCQTCLARCSNRIKSRARTTTSDKDIARRRWLLIDCDAVRPADISSTDTEHEAALLPRPRDIRRVLGRRKACPRQLLADSGNGGHLLYTEWTYRMMTPAQSWSEDVLEGSGHALQ